MPSVQTPIHSGFGPASTTQDVLTGIDLSGKTAIVTGGYAGLGLETVRALREAGARVLVPARDTIRAKAALDAVGAEVARMDLMDPSSVDSFARDFLASGAALHILINNAGIMACPLARDARGYESQFATNHLGHYQLTVRLWPALARAQGARVVALSSLGHRYSAMNVDDPNFHHRDYDRWLAYGQSKTANALFALEFDARGREHGVRAFSVHPGRILTDLAKHLSREELRNAGALDDDGQPVIDVARGMKNVQQGAATSVWAATSPQLQGLGGVYCEDCDIATLVDDTAATSAGFATPSSGVRAWAADPAAAQALWHLSETLTGVAIA